MIINLTPHAVNASGVTFAPSGTIARVNVTRVQVATVEGVPVYRGSYGETVNLPAPDGNLYIVSALVRNANPGRADLLSPGNLIRDEKGNVIGCDGFDTN